MYWIIGYKILTAVQYYHSLVYATYLLAAFHFLKEWYTITATTKPTI